MCGRFAVWLQNLENEIGARYPFLEPAPYEAPEDEGGDEHQPRFYPRYNVAPRSISPVIRRVEVDQHPGAVLQLMKWGVIPHWQKHESNNLSTINARSEGIIDGEPGIWSQLKDKKRCLVPVNGYYEWLKKGNKRIPYYMRHGDKRPVLFAGLWDSTLLEGDKYPTYTFTIITTSSSEQLSFIHDRMPVILESEKDVGPWLDPSVGWTKEHARMLKPYKEKLEFYPVPTEVGKVGTNDPSFVEPVAERKDGIAAMFQKQKRSKKDMKDEDERGVEEFLPATDSPSSNLPSSSAPKFPSSNHTTAAVASDSERMTLGDAKRADKRAAEQDVGQSDEEAHKPPMISPNKKARARSRSPLDHVKDGTNAARAVPKPKQSSPKKNSKHTPQASKITDFFAK